MLIGAILCIYNKRITYLEEFDDMRNDAAHRRFNIRHRDQKTAGRLSGLNKTNCKN